MSFDPAEGQPRVVETSEWCLPDGCSWLLAQGGIQVARQAPIAAAASGSQIPTAAYGLDFDARSVPGVDELGDSRPDHVGSNRCPLGLSDPPLASFFPLPLRASSPSPRQAVNRPRLDSAITRAVFHVITTSRAPSCPSRQDTVVCPCAGARCVPLRSSPQRSRRTRPCLAAPRCSSRRFAPAKIC